MERASTEDSFLAYGAQHFEHITSNKSICILDNLNNGPYGVFIERFETNRLLKQFHAST